jgi:cystathionine beta-lyase
VTFTAATKTFNLAGLGCSMVIASNAGLRDRYRAAATRTWTESANAFSAVATESAYRFGEIWLEQVLEYIRGNYELLLERLAELRPGIQVFPLEGTYLAWLDMRALGRSDEELKERILRNGRVWLDDGPLFGTGGSGFQRINLACPRSRLERALEAMARALG